MVKICPTNSAFIAFNYVHTTDIAILKNMSFQMPLFMNQSSKNIISFLLSLLRHKSLTAFGKRYNYLFMRTDTSTDDSIKHTPY